MKKQEVQGWRNKFIIFDDLDLRFDAAAKAKTSPGSCTRKGRTIVKIDSKKTHHIPARKEQGNLEHVF